MAAAGTLEIEIKTTLDDVTKKLDGVIQKLGIVSKELSSIRGISNFKDISQSAKDASKNIGEMGSQLKQAGKSMNPQLKKASKSLDQIREQYKDLGKGFELKGSSDYLQKQIDSLSNSLEKANLRKKELEAAGKTGGATYENAIKNVIKYENQIDSLKKKLSSLNDGWKPQNDFPISGMVAENEKTAGSGEIFTEDAKEYQKRVADILEKSDKMESAFGGYNAEAMKSTFGESTSEIKNWADAVSKYGQNAGLSLNDIKEKAESVKPGLEEIQSKLKEVYGNVGKGFRLNGSAEYIQKQIDSISNKLEMANLKTKSLEASGDVFGRPYENAVKTVTVYQNMVSGLKEQLSEISTLKMDSSQIDAASGRVHGLRSRISELLSEMKSAVPAVGKFASGLKTAGATLLWLPGSIFKTRSASSGLTNSFSGGIKTLLKYGLGIRSLYVLFNKLRSAIVAGMNNLVQYSSETNSSVSLLSNSMLQLKNSAAAMAAPLLNAIAPALNQIIQLCISAANAINQLISALTGKGTWIRAKKQTNNYAAGLKKAGSSAKKAAKDIKLSVLAFDELNQLTSNKDNEDSGSGGSGGGAGGAGMFETVPIDEGISDFAQRLKDAFNNADWKTVGTMLGEKVNEMVDSIDWNGAGHKIGYGLNAAIQIGYWLLDATNFTNIGTRIAEFLNGAFEEIDFWYLGGLIVKGLEIIPDLIIGFLSGLDWGLVAKSLSDWLIGVYDEATKWLNSYDWSELGNTLWQKLKDAIANIDFAGIAESFARYLGTAIRSVFQLIGGFLGGIGHDIKEWFDKDIKGENWLETAANLLTAIGKGFSPNAIGQWVWDHFTSHLVLAMSGKDSWEDLKKSGKEMAEKVFGGIKEKAQNAWDDLNHLNSEKIQAMEDENSKKWKEISENAKTSFEGIKASISEKWQETKNNTASYWTDIKSDLGTSWNTLKSNAGSTWNTLKSTISTKWGDIKSNTSSVWSGLVDSVKSNWDTMKSNASGAFGDIKEKISDNIQKARDAVKDGIDRMKGFFNFHWELPKIKLPHFNISGSFSLRPPRVPSFSVDWYKTGGLFSDASVIGVGEAGSEAVLPLENRRTMSMIADSIMGNYGYGMDEDKLAEAVERGVAMALMNNQYGDRPINLYAELKTEDNEVLARAVSKGQRSINRRYNPTPQFG